VVRWLHEGLPIIAWPEDGWLNSIIHPDDRQLPELEVDTLAQLPIERSASVQIRLRGSEGGGAHGCYGQPDRETDAGRGASDSDLHHSEGAGVTDRSSAVAAGAAAYTPALELMGHQKIETTTVYTAVPDGAMRRAAAASSLVGASSRCSASAATVRP